MPAGPMFTAARRSRRRSRVACRGRSVSNPSLACVRGPRSPNRATSNPLREAPHHLRAGHAHFVSAVRGMLSRCRGGDSFRTSRRGPFQRAMQRHLDGVSPGAEDLGDLGCLQPGPKAESQKLAIAFVQPRRRRGNRQPANHFVLQRHPRCSAVGLLARHESWRLRLEGAARDPDEPGERRSLPGVVAGPVAQRALEDVARDVLRVRPLADLVREVRANPTDERGRVG